jgi:hypothetical protein
MKTIHNILVILTLSILYFFILDTGQFISYPCQERITSALENVLCVDTSESHDDFFNSKQTNPDLFHFKDLVISYYTEGYNSPAMSDVYHPPEENRCLSC